MSEQIQKIRQLASSGMSKKKAEEQILALLESEKTDSAVQALEATEFYQIVQAVDIHNAIELIEHADGYQIQSCVDFEIWKDDKLSLKALNPWLNALIEVSNESFCRILDDMDPELIPKCLNELEIYVPENPDDDVDLPDAEGYTWKQSPDFSAWIRYPVYDEFGETMDSFIAKMYAAYGVEHTLSALINSTFQLKSDLEEKLYYFKNKRLEDWAIPSKEDAYKMLYETISPFDEHAKVSQDMAELIIRDELSLPEHDNAFQIILDGVDKALFFTLCFRDLDQEQGSKVSLQFFALVNALCVVKNDNCFDPEALADASHEVISYLSLGLEFLSTGSREAGLKILKGYPLKNVFRTAHALLFGLKKQAKAIILSGRLSILEETPTSLLTPEASDVVHGLLNDHPRKYDTTLEWYASMKDLRSAAATLTRVAFKVLFFKTLLGMDREHMARSAFYYDLNGGPESVTFDNLAITALYTKCVPPCEVIVPFDADTVLKKDDLLDALEFSTVTQWLPLPDDKIVSEQLAQYLDALKNNVVQAFGAETMLAKYLTDTVISKESDYD